MILALLGGATIVDVGGLRVKGHHRKTLYPGHEE
jgi:hypothetical protein